VGSHLSVETISLVVQKLFNFIQSHLSILSLSSWTIWVLLRKPLPMFINSAVFLLFPALPSKFQALYWGP
jgi:hypothetical protein